MKGNLCCAPRRSIGGARTADAIVTNDLWGRRVRSIKWEEQQFGEKQTLAQFERLMQLNRVY